MSNTRSMTTSIRPNGIAPVSSGAYKLGAKGGRMASAWQYIWDRMSTTEWRSSSELAQDAAQAFGLKPVTLSEMLCRMRASGVIEQKDIPIPTEYVRKRGRREGESIAQYAAVPASIFTSQRKRPHYRIKR